MLYYREHQSVQRVAEALDLSEDAAKQRLSRGRAMLKQQVAVVVEQALSRSRPGPAFTAAVLGALSGAAPASATAASLASKSLASAKAGLATVLWAPLGNFFVSLPVGWLIAKAGAELTTYERERRYMFRRMLLTLVVFQLIPLIWYYGSYALFCTIKHWHAGWTALGFGAALFLQGLACWMWTAKTHRDRQRIRNGEEAAGTPVRPITNVLQRLHLSAPWEWRSRASFLGLPIVHMLWNRPYSTPLKRARGWIAIGDRAVGLIAVGYLATGFFAAGPVAIGVIAIGLPASFGLFSLGWVPVGVWCYGLLGIGWEVHGLIAVAWQWALGGIAIAHEHAHGMIVFGKHASGMIETGIDAQGALQTVRVGGPHEIPKEALSEWLQLTQLPWFPIALVRWCSC